MKKFLIHAFAMLAISMFAGCSAEYVHIATYIYVNESSRDVNVKSYLRSGGEDRIGPGGEFIIVSGESHELFFTSDARIPNPFSWLQNPSELDYTVFSNGEKQFINKRWSENPEETRLYRKESYTLLKDKKYEKTFQYVFTDKDFENAQPIEP